MQAEEVSAEAIAKLNDHLRKNIPLMPVPHRLMLSNEVAALPSPELDQLLHLVRAFDCFNENNDPHQEHDCARIEMSGKSYMFKFDYFDRDFKGYEINGIRVLTLLHCSEY